MQLRQDSCLDLQQVGRSEAELMDLGQYLSSKLDLSVLDDYWAEGLLTSLAFLSFNVMMQTSPMALAGVMTVAGDLTLVDERLYRLLDSTIGSASRPPSSGLIPVLSAEVWMRTPDS